ncbi:MAG: AmmeMemoRadiSam system protein A [Bulleidia sp.]|nr:AmmeMemoRadiSam system protein A [Bulleidia sp.]
MIIGAVMVPHPPIAVHEVGKGEETKIQATLDAYDKAAQFIAELKPETIVLTSPHAIMYRDYFNISGGSGAYGDLGQFRAEQVTFDETYDTEFINVLESYLKEKSFPAGTEYDRDKMLDHGTMVPLYFIEKRYKDFKLVRIGLSGLPLVMHYELGMMIQKTAEETGRRVVVVGSGDLSHCQKKDGPYGFRKEGPLYDDRIMKTMSSASFGELLEYEPLLLEKSMECGHRSFAIMAGALDRTDVEAVPLSHEATFGVGYGIVLYKPKGRNESRDFLDQYEAKVRNEISETAYGGDPFVSLARKSVNTYVRTGRIMPVPAELNDELKKRAGVFVSIHEFDELRGCIGTISAARRNIAEEIIHNAVSACSRDPRFSPVEEKELPYLQISVDVLGEAEPVSSLSEMDVKRYGIIVTKDSRRGLLLPDLDGVDTPQDQYRIACRKAGIDPDEEDVEIERFEVIRHE